MTELAKVPTLESCEAEIEKAQEAAKDHFAVMGRNLMIIRDSKLYKDSYSTFGEYCQERWQFGKSYAYQLIAGVQVLANLSAQADTQIDQPESAGQVRAIAESSDSPETQAKVWETAKTISDNPTGAVIRKAAAIVTSPGGGESAEIDAALAQMVKLTEKIEASGKRVQLAIEAKVKACRAMDSRAKTYQKRIDNLAEHVLLMKEHVAELSDQWAKTKKQVDE